MPARERTKPATLDTPAVPGATTIHNATAVPGTTASPRRLGACENQANALTHGIGLVAAIAAAPLLIMRAAATGKAVDIVSVSIFCASLITLYLASTLYHVAREEAVKKRRKVFDHCAIYVLIAGSYTPFALAGIGGTWGWSLFDVIWGLAVAGIVFKLLFTGRFKLVSTLLYIGMGWLVIIAVGPMLRAFEPPTLALLLAGGLAYTSGTLFYLNRRIRYSHAIWHLFVMAGSACHAVGIATLLTMTGV